MTQHDETTDADLLAAVAAGDRDALAALYHRHAPLLLVRLRRRCSDAGLVDEVLQDTFVAVWTAAGRYDGRGAVAAWMWGIAFRRLVDGLRRAPGPALALHELVREPQAARSSEDEVLTALEHGDVGQALGRLPSDLQEVLRATVLEGLSTAEAARRLGIPAGTVKTRSMRARAGLRRELACRIGPAQGRTAATPAGAARSA